MQRKEVITNKETIPGDMKIYMNEYIKNNNITDMNSIQTMMKTFFGEAIQSILDAEMSAKIGYNKNERSDVINNRNGYHKTRNINTSYGEVPVSIPRDRLGEFTSDLIPPYSRNINGFEEKIIGLYSTGMSTSEISDQINELYGCNLSNDMISDITDKILPEIREWQKRKLDKVYPIVPSYIDYFVVVALTQ